MEATLTSSTETTAATATAAPTERIAFLDNARAIALTLGILLHAGLGYAALTANLWPSTDKVTSWAFDYWIWVIHTFRMPLFFLIAGFFACYLVNKRGPGSFIKNRLLRITLPFIIFWPIMLACFLGLIFYAATYMRADNAILQLFREAIANAQSGVEQDKPPLSTTHLWFLYYLTQFCLIAALLVRFGRFGHQLHNLITKPWVSLTVLPVITALSLININIPHPAPEKLIPELWAYGFFGLFFLMGWAYFTNKSWLSSLKPYWVYLAISSAICIGLLLFNLPEQIIISSDPEAMQNQWAVTYDFQHFCTIFTTAILAWHLSILFLLAANQFLNKTNGLMRFIADGSYWAYIAHLPIVFYLQLLLSPMNIPILVKFLIVSTGTLAVSYLSYVILVRYTPIGWLLNGRRKR